LNTAQLPLDERRAAADNGDSGPPSARPREAEAEGEGERPASRQGRRTAAKRAADFFKQPYAQKLINNPETTAALEDIYRRSSGQSSSGRSLTFLARRAAAAELQTIVRYLRLDDVVSGRLIRATTSGRTPDMVVTYSASRQPPIERVEITAATQASRSGRPVPKQPAPRSALDEGTIEAAILRKARSAAAGQVSSSPRCQACRRAEPLS
jgi:hypothetical protein